MITLHAITPREPTEDQIAQIIGIMAHWKRSQLLFRIQNGELVVHRVSMTGILTHDWESVYEFHDAKWWANRGRVTPTTKKAALKLFVP